MTNTTNARSALGKVGTLAASSLLIVTMSGCGGSDDTKTDAPSPDPSPSQPVESATPGGDATAAPAPDSMPKETQALVRAGQTGLDQISGSAVYSIDSDRDGWEVEVVTPDGIKHEMDIARDGRSVSRAPKEDGRDAKYLERVQGATLDFQKAVDAILAEVPGARIKELNLDHERGAIVWEADVVTESGEERSLKIAAADGEIMVNKRDT